MSVMQPWRPEPVFEMDKAAGSKTAAVIDEQLEAVKHRTGHIPLYHKRVKIFPKAVRGNFRRAKWTFMVVLLGIYYLAPWLRWGRGAGAPDQAILIDFPSRKFYFFFIEIWPQEVYYLTGLLILAAIGLFFMTSLFGRVWCGYACPQTVWTDLYLWAERSIEGDRNAQMRLDAAPWNLEKLAKRGAKHALWLAIAALTGGAWVFYFADAPTLAREIVTLQAPTAAWITIGFLTGSTYLLAGFAREQVCTYMCPYARFQSAMLDEDSLIVTYRADRGEPRGKHKRGDSWDGRGDCVDCKACVAVCPTGIDIRDGQQLECINCGLCVDACNGIMDKVGRPRGLIGLDTLANLNARKVGKTAHFRFLRPRTFIYAGVLALVAGIMLYGLITRPTLQLEVLRDRNPLFVILSDGSVRNAYSFKVINKNHEPRRYLLTAVGMPQLQTSAVPVAFDHAGNTVFTVESDRLESFRVLAQAPRSALTSDSTDIDFTLHDLKTGEQANYRSVFRSPKP